MKQLLELISTNLRLIDLLDVVLVALIIYRVLTLIKGTRAMQMITGLGILGVAFLLSQSFNLFTTHWVLGHFFDYLILIVIVLFQDDLRRGLTFVGRNPFFSTATQVEEIELIEEITSASIRMASERRGALIVLERETGLKNFIDTGSQIDSRVKSELLFSIFSPHSPIHDGAVIISGGRVAAAGCFLPLSMDPGIDKRFGTRHRAAFGITEDTDAIVILVSEEVGAVHLIKSGKITMNLSEQDLRQCLTALLDVHAGPNGLPKRFKGWIQSLRGRQ